MYKHYFDPIATSEYKDAVEWYGERSISSMENFINSVEKKIEALCKTPTLYKVTYKNHREVSLKKFPYSIVFIIDKKSKLIAITSIYHHKRNPRRKYNK